MPCGHLKNELCIYILKKGINSKTAPHNDIFFKPILANTQGK